MHGTQHSESAATGALPGIYMRALFCFAKKQRPTQPWKTGRE